MQKVQDLDTGSYPLPKEFYEWKYDTKIPESDWNDQEPKTEPENIEVQAESNILKYEDISYIELEIPGFSRDDIDAYFEEDKLIIEGSREEAPGDVEYQRREFMRPVKFKNKFKLGRRTEVDKIMVQNGICTVRLIQIELEKKFLEVE